MPPQTIVITGASDGIGAASARQLKSKGEDVVLVGRSPGKTEAIAAELDASFYTADFSHLDQVRDLGSKLQANHPRIDVLANNAGGIMSNRMITHDGFELTFQVNHLAPFLLTHLLMPTLIASSANVIQTSSIASRVFAQFDIDDLQNEKNYSPNTAYGNGKLANILFTMELHRRFHNQGISAMAFHPGIVATNFAGGSSSWLNALYHSPLRRLMLTTSEKGGELLTSFIDGEPGTSWQSGQYYEKKKAAPKNRPADADALATALWNRSTEMLGL